MEKISDYVLEKKIHKTKNAVTYRGYKEKDFQSVIIKLLNTLHSTPSEIAQFRQEYELIQRLDIGSVVKTIDIIHYKGGLALILEDFDGIPVKDYFRPNEKINIASFLALSANIAATLAALHARGVIHRNIKPQSLLIIVEACITHGPGERTATGI